MGWGVVRSFVRSAWGPEELGDDLVVDSGPIVGVIDGVSYHGSASFTWDGNPVTGGRFAALTAAEAMASAPVECTGLELVELVTDHLQRRVHDLVGPLPAPDRPACVFAAFIPSREEVVWVGDARVRVEFEHRVMSPDTSKVIDDVVTAFRCAMLDAYEASGLEWPDGVDPGRQAVEPLLRMQQALGNTSGEFGFPVINGSPVPPGMIGTCSAEGASRVILATDGYPTLGSPGTASWEEAEQFLDQALRLDPTRRTLIAGTRGVRPGAVSFDDRAWLELINS